MRQVTNLGGGLYQNNLTSTVTSCIFAENSALEAFSGEGGGVYRNGVRGDLKNIYFENNDAALNGGGVFQVH
jgi:predicted outer membrane repeat protein